MKKGLEHFLNQLSTFYMPKHPEMKSGIGHEIEHIKSVINRTKTIVDIINENPSVYKTQEVDRNIATTVACLHDIGNTIGRNPHNIYGRGIVRGKLEVPEIIKYLTSYDLKCRETALQKCESDVTVLPEEVRKCICDAYAIRAKFYMGYKGYNGEQVTQKNINAFLSENIKNRSVLNDERFVKDMTVVIKEGQHHKEAECRYQPRLHNLTEELQKAYPEESIELSLIADAVTEHNIDFVCKKGRERFCASNIYGMIIADADKDNVPETFAARTIFYAINKLAQKTGNTMFVDSETVRNGVPQKVATDKNGKYERDESGHYIYSKNGKYVVNKEVVARHVLHQANERMRPSMAEYEQLTGKTGPMPIFEDSASDLSEQGYVPLRDIKCVTGTRTINGKLRYDITVERGDDIYSQLDSISGKDVFVKLRKNCIDTIQKWANPENEDISIQEILPIVDICMRNKTIEETIDKYEQKENGIADISFSAVIARAIGDFETTKNKPEIERKYLIDKPSQFVLNRFDHYKIVQTYLKSDEENVERRLRKITKEDKVSYFFTVKTTPKNARTLIERGEKEEQITEEKYIELMKEKDENLHDVKKTRYILNHKNQIFELDTYDFADDKAVMEIEMKNRFERIDIPKEIHVIKEVTEDKNFKNRSIARNQGLIYTSVYDEIIDNNNTSTPAKQERDDIRPDFDIELAQ